MPSASRTNNSIKNSLVGIIYYFINLLLNFYSRKVFLKYLGTEVLGLNTTATNLLEFLNLAELGIGFAVAFTLYKPLSNKDHKSINEIVTLQGIIYRRIALFVILGAILLSFFFPLIFKKMQLPLWYAYASFGVLLFSSLLSYFINYKQIILTANQEQYKITSSYKLCQMIKIVVEIILLTNLPNGYLWWLLCEILFTIISSIWLNIIIKRNHPYLSKSKLSYKDLNNKYPGIVIKIKQLFFHKIAAYAVTQTSPLIIYAFLSLTTVAYYGNYLMIISGCTMLLTSLFNGVGASVGNLIAEGNKKKIISVFEELFCIRYIFTITLCVVVYLICQDFITLWLGPEYLLSNITLLLMIIYMYFSLSRGVVDTFLNGYGLFKDIWAPIAETILNIGFSVLGGYLYGLNGIIIGTIISQIAIIFLWKPYFLFTQGISVNISIYISNYCKCILSSLLPLIIIYFTHKYIPENKSFVSLIIDGALYFILFLTTNLFTIYYLTSGGKILIGRLVKIVTKK